MNVALLHAPQRPCCVAERNDKSPDSVRRLPDLRPQNIKRPDVRDGRARVGAAEDSKRPRRPRKVPRRARVTPPRPLRKWTAGSCRWRSAGERSARGLGGRKRGGNRGGVVGQEGVVCCRRDGKEEHVDKRRARRRVGKRPRQVRGDPGRRVLLEADKPPEDAPAARVKLGVGGRERRRKRPRSVERPGRCAGVPLTNRLAEGRVERAAERSNRVVPDRPGDLLRALRREVGGDGRKRVGVERSSQRPAEGRDLGDGRDPGRDRLLLRQALRANASDNDKVGPSSPWRVATAVMRGMNVGASITRDVFREATRSRVVVAAAWRDASWSGSSCGARRACGACRSAMSWASAPRPSRGAATSALWRRHCRCEQVQSVGFQEFCGMVGTKKKKA